MVSLSPSRCCSFTLALSLSLSCGLPPSLPPSLPLSLYISPLSLSLLSLVDYLLLSSLYLLLLCLSCGLSLSWGLSLLSICLLLSVSLYGDRECGFEYAVYSSEGQGGRICPTPALGQPMISTFTFTSVNIRIGRQLIIQHWPLRYSIAA